MRASVAWINDYLDRPAGADEIARVLTDAGFPVESRADAEGGDVALEVELTSNRGDCLCHVGLAREVAASTGRAVREPSASYAADPQPASALLTVRNDDHGACPRYTARVIRGVRVGPSPDWMQARLRAIGQVPRNCIVDCTNFVLFELGQPTHAFDLSRLHGSMLQVRRARAGERFLPLGEGAQELALRGGELVIADAEVAVALAGVKGGSATSVHGSTVDLAIESATFDPVAVRHTSRGLRISSDSSYRFERGVDAAAVDWPAERLVSLILEVAGGRALSGSLSAGAAPAPRAAITLRLARLRAITGIDIEASEAERILRSLGFSVRSASGSLECVPPPHRLDVDREADLIEEVLRVAGIDRVPLRETVSIRVPPAQPSVDGTRAIRDCLVSCGLVEAVTHTLISERAAAHVLPEGRSALMLADERTAGEPVLRPSLLPSLLQCVARNRDQGSQDVRLFECARIFSAHGESHDERTALAIAIAGPDAGPDAYRQARGAVERALSVAFGPVPVAIGPAGADAVRLRFGAGAHAMADAGIVLADGAEVGVIGILSADASRAFGIDGPVAAAELDMQALLSRFPPSVRVRANPAFPGVDRDVSLLVDAAMPWSRIESCVRAHAPAMLESIDFVGTYRGPQVGAGRKSVTLRLLFRATDRTLRREEVDAAMAPLVAALSSDLPAEVRQ